MVQIFQKELTRSSDKTKTEKTLFHVAVGSGLAAVR